MEACDGHMRGNASYRGLKEESGWGEQASTWLSQCMAVQHEQAEHSCTCYMLHATSYVLHHIISMSQCVAVQHEQAEHCCTCYIIHATLYMLHHIISMSQCVAVQHEQAEHCCTCYMLHATSYMLHHIINMSQCVAVQHEQAEQCYITSRKSSPPLSPILATALGPGYVLPTTAPAPSHQHDSTATMLYSTIRKRSTTAPPLTPWCLTALKSNCTGTVTTKPQAFVKVGHPREER